ncbi:long-tail fiber protein [Aeromonas phage avDM12-TAAL]|nr:long-tail fiber protein [Aeromonas phage avDM12-TAAL]
MADLKLGSQIGGNLIWHQGILELNPLDDSLFYKEFDLISSKGGQTINGAMSLKGIVDTTAQVIAAGVDTAWQGGSANAAFQQQIDNTSGAHWLLASRRKNGSARAGIQVLTNDAGNFRIYTNNLANYTDFGGGQVSIQATTPSSAAHATRKDYVDKEVDRAMQFAETTTDKLTADLATANTRINTLDAQNVKITGNQNIAGTKTFTDLPVIQDQPTADTHAANKKYVDTKVGTAVQSIATTAPLTTTGGVTPTLAITAATRTAAGSMSTSDKVKLDDLPADALSRSGGNMKNNGIIKLEGVGGINSLYNSKEYSIFRDHNNGNVTLSAASGDLYLGYNTTSEVYTTKNVVLHQAMKWNAGNGRVLVDTDGFIPWASIKDRVGLEGKSKMLRGPINFDEYESSGFYNLYLARATGSVNPPPFDYGTMIVTGADKDGNTFVTQIATNKVNGTSYTRTRNDGKMEWGPWRKSLDTGDGAAKRTMERLGYQADAKPMLILFAPRYKDKALSKRGFVGRITFERGSTVSNLQANYIDISAVSAYTQQDVEIHYASSYANSKLVYHTHTDGVEYIALYRGTASSNYVYIDGYVYGEDPILISDATGLTVTDIVTREKIYSSGNKPTNDDLNLVSRAGDEMTGSLTIKNNAPQIHFVETDNGDKRWSFAADGKTFRIHENTTGITEPDMVLRANENGNTEIRKPVSTTPQVNLPNALVRKDYADAIDAKNVAKAGDTMNGTLVAASIKNAIQVNNKGSISMQDGAGTRYHMFVDGNLLRINHGNNGETSIFSLNQLGGVSALGTVNAKQFTSNDDAGFVSARNASQGMFVGADGRTIIGGGTNTTDQASVQIRPGGIGNMSNITSFQADGKVIGKWFVGNTVGVDSNGRQLAMEISAGTDKLPYISVDYAYRALEFNNNKTVTAVHGFEINSRNGLSQYYVRPSGFVGGWARGLALVTGTDPSVIAGGVGFYGGGDKPESVYLGMGGSPWAVDQGIQINTNNQMSLKAGQSGAAIFDAGASAMFRNDNSKAWYHISKIAPDSGIVISHGQTPDMSRAIAGFGANNIDLNPKTYVNSGQFQIRTGGNPVLEFHVPGKHGRIMWVDHTTGDLNIGTSNGAFGEAARIATINTSTIKLNGATWSNAYGHAYAAQYTTIAPFHVDYGAIPGASDYYPLVRSRGYATGAGYTTDVDLGVLRQGNTWGQGVIRVGSAEAGTANTQAIYYFDISGNFKAPAGVYDSGNRVYSASNPPPAGGHNHLNIRARGAVTLWSGDLNAGNFALNQPWTNFDMILFVAAWDNNECFTSKTFTRYDLEYMQAIGVNYDISGGAGGIEWYGRFAGDNQTFVTYKENSRMRFVIGYNLQTVN